MIAAPLLRHLLHMQQPIPAEVIWSLLAPNPPQQGAQPRLDSDSEDTCSL